MKRVHLAILGLVLLAGYGVAEGIWTHRWVASAELAQATARLQDVPGTIGDWEGTDQVLDPRQVAQAEMSGYLLRDYMNQRTGARLSVLLVCGRPGPTALHTPEVCYPGAGFNPAGTPSRKSIATKTQSASPPAPNDFWVGHFQKTGAAAESLRIFWSWNGAGTWHAADAPRLHFGHHAALYKLYVIRQLTHADDPLGEDPTLGFLEQFLPAVQRALFSTTGNGQRSDS